MNQTIYIPNRFESVLSNPNLKATPLILPVQEDLKSFDFLRHKAEVQGGGILSFLLGVSGIGKTTSVYSTAACMPEKFTRVYTVPTDLELREVLSWLRKGNLPSPSKKTHLILFDGREVTDDAVGLREFLSGLNQLLRGRKDILFFWPTTDPEWHRQIRDTAQKIGGTNFAPLQSDIQILGLPRIDWIKALERVLIQLDLSFEDLAVNIETLEATARKSNTIGEFFGYVGDIIAERVTNIQIYKKLPSLVFVVTSDSMVAGEANRIRWAGTYILKAEELLAYSGRSKAGEWWKERSKTSEHHLAYIISLFNARLTTMSPSAVSYACVHYGEEALRNAVLNNGVQQHTSNAKKALQSTEYRFLTEETVSELTSTRKGKTKAATDDAYAAIQSLSSKRHKAINTAICLLIKQHTEDFEAIAYEVDAGEQKLFTDAIIEVKNREMYLEFHHLSSDNCLAAKIAAYIMEKLQNYAIRYNLVPI